MSKRIVCFLVASTAFFTTFSASTSRHPSILRRRTPEQKQRLLTALEHLLPQRHTVELKYTFVKAIPHKLFQIQAELSAVSITNIAMFLALNSFNLASSRPIVLVFPSSFKRKDVRTLFFRRISKELQPLYNITPNPKTHIASFICAFKETDIEALEATLENLSLEENCTAAEPSIFDTELLDLEAFSGTPQQPSDAFTDWTDHTLPDDQQLFDDTLPDDQHFFV